MSSIVVRGLVLPVAVDGHPALDFCNTVAGWGSDAPKDYLLSYAHLVVWAGARGLVSPRAVRALRGAAEEPGGRDQAEQVVTEARDLRTAAYAVLLGSRRRDHVALLSRELVRARASSTLDLAPLAARPGEGVPLASWQVGLGVQGILDQDLPLLAVAAAVDEAVTQPLLGVVRACPGDGCGWLFVDVSGRRRWCDMAVCGNRAKARRYAARRSGRRDRSASP